MKRKKKTKFAKSQHEILIAFSAITFMVIILIVIFLLLNLKINQAVIPNSPVHSLPTPVEIISTPLRLPATWTVAPFISQTPKPSSTAIFTVTPFIFIIEEFTPTNTEVPQYLPTKIPSDSNPALDLSDPNESSPQQAAGYRL